MIALVLAMIVLQNADPDPVKTPAASLGQRLTGSAPVSALQGLDTTSPFGDMTVTVGCTYGAPRLGPALLSDANDLSRTLTMSNCSDPTGQSFLTPLAYPSLVFLGHPTGVSGVSVPNFVQSPMRAMTTFTMNARPERSFAIQHLLLPTEFSGGAGSVTGAQFHATTSTSHPLPATRKVVPATHQQ